MIRLVVFKKLQFIKIMKSEKIRVHLYRTAADIKKELIETDRLWPKVIININLSKNWYKDTYRDLSDLSPALIYAIDQLEKQVKETKLKTRNYMWFLKKYWCKHHYLPQYIYMFKEDFFSFLELLEIGISLQYTNAENNSKLEQIGECYWNNQLDLEHWKKTLNSKK